MQHSTPPDQCLDVTSIQPSTTNSDQRSDDGNILQLNDDCFYHILKFIPIIDWCSLRETCSRLRTISDYCFQRQVDTFQLAPTHVADSPFGLLSLNECKHLIRIFGHFVTTLTINRKHFGNSTDPGALVPLLDRYCNALLDLKFVDVDLDEATIARCDRLFSNLHRLVIDRWSDAHSFVDCLARCVALKELELIRVPDIDGVCLVNLRFDRLESFSMNGCNDFDYSVVKPFLLNHRQLKKVKILNTVFNADCIMADVANTLVNLVELSLLIGPGSQLETPSAPVEASVAKLNSLKKFEIDLTFVTVDCANRLLSGLAINNNVDDLHLASFRTSDESIRRLCALKTLTTLKLTAANRLDEKTCRKLASELPALLEIHIVECNGVTFKAMNEFVVQSMNLTRIVFNRNDDEEPSLKPDVFRSLIDAQKKKQTTEILSIFLNDDDLMDIRSEFELFGISATLAEQANNIVTLLPLEEKHRKTVYEFGSRFVRQNERRHNDFFSFSEASSSLSIFDDDFDDDFDDRDHFW